MGGTRTHGIRTNVDWIFDILKSNNNCDDVYDGYDVQIFHVDDNCDN